MPGWALTVVFAAGFVVLGAGAYYGYRHFYGERQASGARLEDAAAAQTVAEAKAPSIVDRYIEVTGLRVTEDLKQNAEARFVVVNHSGAEITNLSGEVKLRVTTAGPGDPPAGTFSFKVPSLGPYEARDLKAVVQTRLRAYELPDWQFLRAEVTITSP